VKLPTGAQFPPLLEIIETPENGRIASIKLPESFVDASLQSTDHPLGANLLKEREHIS
jgi:hypothetical protein